MHAKIHLSLKLMVDPFVLDSSVPKELPFGSSSATLLLSGGGGRLRLGLRLPVLLDLLEGVATACAVDLPVADLQLLGRVLVLEVLHVAELHPERVLFRHLPLRGRTAVALGLLRLLQLSNALLERFDLADEFLLVHVTL